MIQSFKYNNQLQLFNNYRLITNKKQLTTVVGDYFEEATKNLIGLKRLNIHSKCNSCPDLCDDIRTNFFESKASNYSSGGAAIKLSQFNQHVNLRDFWFPSIYEINPIFIINIYYILWYYDGDCFHKKIEVVRKKLSDSIKYCFILPLDDINQLFGNKDVKHNKRLRLNLVKDYIKAANYHRKVSLTVYGNKTKRFNLYCI